MKVYVDSQGALVNIGDWDTCIGLDENGDMVETNPIPDGVREIDAEVSYTSAGRAFLSDNYYDLRRCEYPSIGDQLDALFQAGAFPADMAAKLQAVKDRYPKPD
ncbi:hypothetical protein [Pseudomonas putida]|uniref:hypothetical protein n=1 Tax=Pseudomonas putida TaxID=303 RepID=UPI0031332859